MTIEKEQIVRAIRSFERNRTLAAKCEERLARARGQVRTFLDLSGLTSARLGPYAVELRGEDLLVTVLPAEDWEQLELFPRAVQEAGLYYRLPGEPERGVIPFRPEDLCTAPEAELLQNASQGLLKCPQCQKPLQGSLLIAQDYQGVVLACPDQAGCGFREY